MAITKYQCAIEEIQQNEQQEQQAMEAQRIIKQELQLHKVKKVYFKIILSIKQSSCIFLMSIPIYFLVYYLVYYTWD